MQVDEAKLEIALLNAEVAEVEKIDIITQFTNRGLPQEIITRIDYLWDHTKTIAGEVIHIGKIIVIKIWEFVEANPHMAIGVVVGAAVGSLINLIPFIGHLLAPIAMTIGAIYGGVIGHRIDKRKHGIEVTGGKSSLFEDLISMAKVFFQFFAEILNALKEYFSN
jgi:hypothetical protein